MLIWASNQYKYWYSGISHTNQYAAKDDWFFFIYLHRNIGIAKRHVKVDKQICWNTEICHHHHAAGRNATKATSVTSLLLSICFSAVRVMSMSRSLCLSASGFSWWYPWTGDAGALSLPLPLSPSPPLPLSPSPPLPLSASPPLPLCPSAPLPLSPSPPLPLSPCPFPYIKYAVVSTYQWKA